MEYLPVDDEELDAAEAAADGAASAAELAWMDEAEAELAAVEAALGRLDDGTYGRCEACGGPVADADLAQEPTVRRCADHLPLGLS